MTNEKITELIETIKARELSASKMEALAECFLKVAVAETGNTFGMDYLIQNANDDLTQIKPLLSIGFMTVPKLAHIMLGCQKILMDIDIEVSLEDIENVCEIARERSSSMLMPSQNQPKKNKWRPIS